MESKEKGFMAADLFLNHVNSIPAYTAVSDLNMEIVNKIGLKLGLLFISENEISGETCFAHNEEIRPEFKLSFTVCDLLFYLKALLNADNGGNSDHIMHQNIPYPGDARQFWALVEKGKYGTTS